MKLKKIENKSESGGKKTDKLDKLWYCQSHYQKGNSSSEMRTREGKKRKEQSQDMNDPCLLTRFKNKKNKEDSYVV